MIDPDALTRARTLLARLELVSHGGTQNLAPEPGRNAEQTAAFPPGGIARKDDREPDHPLKSHDHFKRRVRGAPDTETIDMLNREMEAALKAWTHSTPPPADSLAWRRQVGTEQGSVRDVAARWGISPSRVHQLRKQYGERAA